MLASTPNRITDLVRGWDARRWSETYAPGKWTAAQLVLHLAHDEIGFCNRVRLALTVDRYVVQPYEGADWVGLETPTEPETALAAFLALRNLNLILYRRIPLDRRARPILHPDLVRFRSIGSCTLSPVTIFITSGTCKRSRHDREQFLNGRVNRFLLKRV